MYFADLIKGLSAAKASFDVRCSTFDVQDAIQAIRYLGRAHIHTTPIFRKADLASPTT
jgi:hypothetical protein